jgi:hypothetical protein
MNLLMGVNSSLHGDECNSAHLKIWAAEATILDKK